MYLGSHASESFLKRSKMGEGGRRLTAEHRSISLEPRPCALLGAPLLNARNRDYRVNRKNAADYKYCPEVELRRSTRVLFAFHKLPQRFMKDQLLHQWYLARCTGGVGLETTLVQTQCSRYYYCYCRNKKSYIIILGYQLYCFQYITAVVLFCSPSNYFARQNLR